MSPELHRQQTAQEPAGLADRQEEASQEPASQQVEREPVVPAVRQGDGVLELSRQQAEQEPAGQPARCEADQELPRQQTLQEPAELAARQEEPSQEAASRQVEQDRVVPAVLQGDAVQELVRQGTEQEPAGPAVRREAILELTRQHTGQERAGAVSPELHRQQMAQEPAGLADRQEEGSHEPASQQVEREPTVLTVRQRDAVQEMLRREEEGQEPTRLQQEQESDRTGIRPEEEGRELSSQQQQEQEVARLDARLEEDDPELGRAAELGQEPARRQQEQEAVQPAAQAGEEGQELTKRQETQEAARRRANQEEEAAKLEAGTRAAEKKEAERIRRAEVERLRKDEQAKAKLARRLEKENREKAEVRALQEAARTALSGQEGGEPADLAEYGIVDAELALRSLRAERDRVLQMARYADGTTMTSTWVCISGVPLVRATDEWERLIVDILAGAGLKPVMASIHKASSHGRTAGMLNICEGMGDLMVQILVAEAFSVGGRRGIRDIVTSITLGRRSYIVTGIQEDPGKAKLRTVAILRGCPQADGAAGAAVEDVQRHAVSQWRWNADHIRVWITKISFFIVARQQRFTEWGVCIAIREVAGWELIATAQATRMGMARFSKPIHVEAGRFRYDMFPSNAGMATARFNRETVIQSRSVIMISGIPDDWDAINILPLLMQATRGLERDMVGCYFTSLRASGTASKTRRLTLVWSCRQTIAVDVRCVQEVSASAAGVVAHPMTCTEGLSGLRAWSTTTSQVVEFKEHTKPLGHSPPATAAAKGRLTQQTINAWSGGATTGQTRGAGGEESGEAATRNDPHSPRKRTRNLVDKQKMQAEDRNQDATEEAVGIGSHRKRSPHTGEARSTGGRGSPRRERMGSVEAEHTGSVWLQPLVPMPMPRAGKQSKHGERHQPAPAPSPTGEESRHTLRIQQEREPRQELEEDLEVQESADPASPDRTSYAERRQQGAEEAFWEGNRIREQGMQIAAPDRQDGVMEVNLNGNEGSGEMRQGAVVTKQGLQLQIHAGDTLGRAQSRNQEGWGLPDEGLGALSKHTDDMTSSPIRAILALFRGERSQEREEDRRAAQAEREEDRRQAAEELRTALAATRAEAVAMEQRTIATTARLERQREEETARMRRRDEDRQAAVIRQAEIESARRQADKADANRRREEQEKTHQAFLQENRNLTQAACTELQRSERAAREAAGEVAAETAAEQLRQIQEMQRSTASLLAAASTRAMQDATLATMMQQMLAVQEATASRLEQERAERLLASEIRYKEQTAAEERQVEAQAREEARRLG